MSSSRPDRTNYGLRDLPRQDYRHQLGQQTARRAILVDTANETITQETSVKFLEQGMEQLAAALAELTRFQQEQERRHEERHLREEEHQQLQEERRRQQYEEHQEQVRTMHEQHAQQLETMMETLKERRPTEHLKVAAYKEGEDIQDILEAFEGIMDLQDVPAREWVLQLTPLLKGKARAVYTDPETTAAGYNTVKTAILNVFSINPERSRKQFHALTWTRDSEPTEWVSKGVKLMRMWLQPDKGVDTILNRVAVEQLVNGLPHKLKMWVASHTPETPAAVAELIEAYDSAHGRTTQNREKPRYQDYKPTHHDRPNRDSGRQKNESTYTQRERKPMSEIQCYKCQKKGHISKNCMDKTYQIQEGKKDSTFVGEGQVNGKPMRMHIDSGASRTVVNRDLISPADIEEETIVVNFGNGATGEYLLASIKVKMDGEEYQVKAAVVRDLAE